LYAMPPPEPPSVNAGRMMSGYDPISSAIARPCSSLQMRIAAGEYACSIRAWRKSRRNVRAGGARLRRLEADASHSLLEQLAILSHADGVQLGADQLHVVARKHATLSGTRGHAEAKQTQHTRSKGSVRATTRRTSASATARLSAVWPPMVGSNASGFSCSGSRAAKRQQRRSGAGCSEATAEQAPARLVGCRLRA